MIKGASEVAARSVNSGIRPIRGVKKSKPRIVRMTQIKRKIDRRALCVAAYRDSFPETRPNILDEKPFFLLLLARRGKS